MKSSVKTSWKGNLTFSSQVGIHNVVTDAPKTHGGDNTASSPKSLMITALAGCTGIDVVSTLKKMRVELEDFSMEIQSEQTKGFPSVYTAMHIIYEFKGKDLDPNKIKRAVELSQNKYCGVSAMYKKIMDISWEIKIC